LQHEDKGDSEEGKQGNAQRGTLPSLPAPTAGRDRRSGFFGPWIARLPARATVAVPGAIVGIQHPEHTLGVAEHQLGYLNAKGGLIQFAAIA
jgi:hypothetical protein